MTEADKQRINILIAEIANDNVSALDELARLVSARMLSVAVSVLRNKSLAEDAVQDSFIKIVDNAAKFKAGTNGYAWICKIVQNTALNILRKESGRACAKLDEFFDLSDDVDVAETVGNAATVRSAMSVLSAFEKRIIYQKYFMDMTVRDSAKSLGKSKSAIARAITAAEDKMRVHFGMRDKNDR